MISIGDFNDRKHVLFDIGSSNTRMSVNDTIVFFEPSCIAIHKKTNAVLAIGAKAASLLGKTPDSIEVVFPIKAGAVASEEYTIRFLDALLQNYVQSDVMTSFFGYKGTASIPSHISPVNRLVWKRVFEKAGVSSITFVENAQAIYAHIAGPKALAHSVCILDIGGQKSDIAVLSASEIVVARSFDIGGVECTEMVQDTLLEKETFIVGWQSAEQCKKEIATVAGKKNKEKKIVMRGKDAYHHIAKTLPIQSTIFNDDLQLYAQKLLQEVQQFFSIVPPELASSTLERGMYIVGGGSLLNGLQNYLEEGLKTEIIILPEPQLTSIKGLIRLKK